MLLHEHCSSCYQISCSFSDCPIIKCKNCHIPLHACKSEDHMAHICREARVPCPNMVNGCKQRVIREKMPNHIPKCLASAVVCSRERGRKLNMKSGKLELKYMGMLQITVPTDHEDIDVALASYDQNLITDSYKSLTLWGRQRELLHSVNPMIPLKNMPSDQSTTTAGLEDSSEDEMREKKEKTKKSSMLANWCKSALLNCCVCLLFPFICISVCVRTLRNDRDDDDGIHRRRKKVTPQVLDNFHKNHNLKINIAVQNVPEISLKYADVLDLKKLRSLYTIKCLRTIHRSEYGDHCFSQHSNTVDQLHELVLRCPNWTRGCDFRTSRIGVKNGKLRFHAHSTSITHYTDKSTTSDDHHELQTPQQLNIENLPLWVYELLADYLPSSSLYNLSLTNKKLREIIFLGCTFRCYVEPEWKRSDNIGKWILSGHALKISSSEPPPPLEWRVPVELSKHIPNCSHFEPVVYEEQMVSVFPRNLGPAISNEFTEYFKLINAELREQIRQLQMQLQEQNMHVVGEEVHVQEDP